MSIVNTEDIIGAIRSLDENELTVLASLVRKCEMCGRAIVKSNGKRRYCFACSALKAREGKAEWSKMNYASVPYEHDTYISKRR